MRNPVITKGFYLQNEPSIDEKQINANQAITAASRECYVVSMFFNSDKGLLVYDSYPRGEIYSKLISIKIPSHFFVTKVFYLRYYRSSIKLTWLTFHYSKFRDVWWKQMTKA